MTENSRNIRQQHKQSGKTKPFNEEELVFRFTAEYIRKVKVLRWIVLPTCLVWFVFSNYCLFELLPRRWYFSLLYVISLILCFINAIKYGVSKVYGDDIIIKNNRIYYNKAFRMKTGVTMSSFVVEDITKVEVKPFHIVIYGHAYEETGFGNDLKKLTFPKGIENVDEFIKIAKSLSGKA